ncbi:hypothetical protein DXG01_007836 [Tephrocybe rancida]|nr:hypothetical protein DXG01_007836 [Tephrocybe rancida]
MGLSPPLSSFAVISGMNKYMDPAIPITVDKDQYSVVATKPCDVKAQNGQVASKIWFRTPALDEDILKKVVSIQLETKSRDQGWVEDPEAGSWSWFDIVVLESPESTKIKVKDGVALVWMSHTNHLGEKEDAKQVGPVFGSQHDIFAALEVGDVLGVRVCARFADWANHASEARLTLQVPEKGKPADGPRRRPNSLPERERNEYLRLVSEQITSLTDTFDAYLNAATPAEAPPASSLVREMLPTGPLRADQVAAAEEPPLRLLSLDGGGVRGISSLYILQAIMAKVSPNNPNVMPCDYFDMICGTSTGGLIAIMLGRLQMTIPECIEVYTSLASDIFSASFLERGKNFATTGAYYKKDKFEAGLKKIIKEKTGNENASMLDPDPNNKCKVFVVAGRSQNLSGSAEHFRTYPTEFRDPFAGCPIWQAARATSAAPIYLPAITIRDHDSKDVEFVDGGIRFNNPSILLMGKVNTIFGCVRHIRCLLSIGTGRQPDISLRQHPSSSVGATLHTKPLLEAALHTKPLLKAARHIKPLLKATVHAKSLFKTGLYTTSLLEASVKLMVDCEMTHDRMKGEMIFHGKDDVYFRFNTVIQVGDNQAPMIGLDDYEGMPKLVSLTKDYLAGQTSRVEHHWTSPDLTSCYDDPYHVDFKDCTRSVKALTTTGHSASTCFTLNQRFLTPATRRSISTHSNPVDLSYEAYIPPNGDKTSGAVVILHGLFGSKRNFASLCKAFLRDLDRPIYALDLRNHGASPHATPMTYESMAADVRHFIVKNGLEDVSLLGHSMGGKVAMTLALSPSPPSLANLIVSDIAPTRSSLSPSFKRYLGVMAQISDPASKIRTREEADSAFKAEEKDLGIRQFLLTNLAVPSQQSNETVKFKIPVDILTDAIAELGSFPYMPDGLRQWPGRALVVKGAKSDYIQNENMVLFEAFFPNMQLEVLDTGHWVHAEKPNEFKKLFVDFILGGSHL